MFQGLMCFLALVWIIKLEGKRKGKKKDNKDAQYFFFNNFIDRE